MTLKQFLVFAAILILVIFVTIVVRPVAGQGEYVTYVHDEKHGVGCWITESANGIAMSCLPDPGRCEGYIPITETLSLVSQ